jgi:hypothetical protein
MSENPMQNEERQTMREHIIFLGTQLEAERKSNQAKTELLKRFMDREDLGWAVSEDLLIDEAFRMKEVMDHAA